MSTLVQTLLAIVLLILAAISPDANARTGWATWYASRGPGAYAATPEWRWPGPDYRVRVCALEGSRACTIVVVSDHCGCGVRTHDGQRRPTIIDLSPEVFRRLAPTSQGVLLVRVEALGAARDTAPRPELTLPPTDTGG